MEPVATTAVAIGLLTTMVIGATELVKRLFDRDYRASALIGVSAVVGAVAGWLTFPEVGFALGLVTGLGASGLVTTVQKLGTGTTSSPSNLDRPADPAEQTDRRG
jgi:hypothetical protein